MNEDKKEQALTVQEEQAIIAKQEEEKALAEFYQTDNTQDYERMDQEDIILPRVRLLQAKAPECEAGDLKPGSIVNNVSGTVLIGDPKNESVRMIPCFHYNTRMRWWPMDSGEEGFQCRSEDGLTGVGDPGGDCKTCPYAKFEDDKTPECKKGINFVMLFPDGTDADRFALVMFNRTSYKVGKKIINMARMSEGRMFTNIFELGTKLDGDGTYTWWEWTLVRNEDEKLMSKVKDLNILRAADGMAKLTKDSRSKGTLIVADEPTCDAPDDAGTVSDDDDVPF